MSAAQRQDGRPPAPQRRGDAVAIPGDYQARALREGFVVQRFWHGLKFDVVERVCPPRAGARVIDIGCGSGVVAGFLAERAGQVDAVDANPSAVEYARQHATRGNIRFHLGYAQELGFAEGTFDFAYCMEVLEHLDARSAAALMRHARRILKPGGRLLVTTPNYAGAWPIIEWLMDHLRLAPRLKEGQHVTRFTPRRLRRLGRRAGLKELAIGRFCGLAPFAAVLSRRLARCVNDAETRCGNPLGHLLYAVWSKG